MFSQRKGKVDITHASPTFCVRYVGKTEVFASSGRGCTRRPVQRIWDASAGDERDMPRCALVVDPGRGILLTYTDAHANAAGRQELYDIRDISYCSAESAPHERVFAWICKNAAAKKLECHAVLCGSPEKTQAVSVCLNRAFQIAYRDWKNQKEKMQRMKQHALVDKGQSSRSEKEVVKNGQLSEKEERELNEALAQMNFVEEEEINGEESSIRY